MTGLIDHHCRVLSSPIEGVHGTQIESAREFGRHSHATFGFGLLERGAQRSWSGRGSVEAFVGDVITTNPGEVHDGRPLGTESRRWRMVYLEPAVFASWAGDGMPGMSIELTRPVIRDASLGRSVRALFECIEAWCEVERGAAAVEALACEEALVRAGALLLGRYGLRRPDDRIGSDVRGVRDKLADSLLDPPSLAELAASVGASKFQVLRRFEKAYGMAPHAWLVQRRVDHAQRLIRSGCSLVDAAAASGFADQSHMNRHFVRHLGFTPGTWKKAFARR